MDRTFAVKGTSVTLAPTGIYAIARSSLPNFNFGLSSFLIVVLIFSLSDCGKKVGTKSVKLIFRSRFIIIISFNEKGLTPFINSEM